MEYCITINPIPHSQYRTKFDYEWSIEYQLIRNPLVSVNIRSANLVIFKILYYGMEFPSRNRCNQIFTGVVRIPIIEVPIVKDLLYKNIGN